MIQETQTRQLRAVFPVLFLILATTGRGDGQPVAALPKMDLPDGFVVEIAVPSLLAKHPIMASLGPPGRLFVGDSSGTNLDKAGLEKTLPHRVLLLTDTNADGVYDKASVFA